MSAPAPMEEEAGTPDLLSVLAQVAPELVDVLHRQSDDALERLFRLLGPPGTIGWGRGVERSERIRHAVELLGSAGSAECAQFVHTLTMMCNLPLHLESQLVSAAGYEHSGEQQLDEQDPPPHPPKRKYSLRDPVQHFEASMKASLLQRYEQLCRGLVRPVQLADVRVAVRRIPGRPREAEDGSTEHITTAESFLRLRKGVTVLLGPAGSGKTVVAHCVACRWAQGQVPRFRLLLLLEFRQLNMVAECISLWDLLSRHSPCPEDEEAEAVLTFILAHPEQVCLIFDGYDEFHTKFSPLGAHKGPCEPRLPLPLAELFLGLCSGTILPGCSLLVTCRVRDLLDLTDSTVDCVGELLGFDQPQVVEYVEQYFQGKGHGKWVMRHLLESRHLLNMCSVPALCQICCICLDHLFSREPCSAALLPATVTQVYVHILRAFLSQGNGHRAEDQVAPLLRTYQAEVKELSRLAMRGLDDDTIVFCTDDLRQEVRAFAMSTGLLCPQELWRPDGSFGEGCTFMHLTMQEFLGALYLMTSEGATEAQLRKKLNLKSRWTMKSDPKSVFTDSVHLYLCGLSASACTPYLMQLASGDSWVRQRQAAVLKGLQQFAGSASLTGPKVLELCRCVYESQDEQLARSVGLRCRFELRNISLTPVDMEALVFVISAGRQNVVIDFGGCSMELECLEVLVTCQHISCLTFRSRKYDDKFAEAVAAVLPRLPNLRRFAFIGGNMTEAGAGKLAQALESCPRIAELNLSDNILGDRGLQDIAEVLPKMAGLTTVHLGKNSVSLDGVLTMVEKLVTCPTFQKLHMDDLKDTREIRVLLSHSHVPAEEPTLSLLNCRFTADRMNRLCDVLTRCPALSAVHLSGRGITNDVLQVLCGSLSKLRVSRQIVLANSSLTVDGLPVLSRSLTTCSGVTGVKARLEEPPEVCVLFERGGKTPGEKIMGRVPLLSKKLWLTHCSLHSAHMDRLFQTIAGCPQLTLLDLSNNTFGNNGLKKLLGLLPQLSDIQEINVSNNGVTVEGVLLLAETLRTCGKLRVVDVSHGGEQRIIMKFHTNKSQQQVNDPEAPTMMENDLPLFKKLSLQQSHVKPGSMEDLCTRLAQCGGLVQLDFSGGSLDRSSVEKLVKHLPDMTRLKVLNLSGNLLGDEGIRHFVKLLPDLHTLATVSLNNNNLTQTGALHLVRAMSVCAQLVAVEVSLGQEDRSVIQFAHSSACDLSQSLSLRECHFGADHLQKLTDILLCCPHLGKVHMCCNKLPDELGVLLKALSKVNTLASLEIQNNGLTPQVIEALLRDLHCNPRHLEIRVDEPWLKAEAAVNLISSCLNLNPNIQHIRVEETTLSITLEMSDYQGTLHTELSIPGADPVSVSSVQSIGLVDCALQGQHLEVLRSICQRCPQLLELDLSHNSSGTELGPILSSLLPVLQNLTKLSLDHHVIDDHAAAVLAKILPGLPKLCIISLSQCSGFTTVGACHLVTALSHCHLLEDISLRALQLQKEAMACLATGLHRMTSVKRLILSKVTVAPGSSDKVALAILPMLESLEQLRGIKVIELDELLMGEQGLQELVKHVAIWTGLRRISLCNNCITDDTGARLVEALSHCMALEEIILSRNHLGDTSASHLGQVLPSLTHLRVLDLQMNCLQPPGAVTLISAFKDCRSLTDIVLSENQLGSLGIEKLSAALPHMCSLRKLHLVSVGTSDLSNLASSLGNCSYAEDISLAWNGVTDDVAEMLAEVLPLCQQLKRVDLEANSISVRGAEALAASVHCSASVQVIRLWKNPIPREELQRLSEKEKRLSFSSM